MIAVHEIDHPRRTVGGREESVKLLCIHEGVDGPRHLVAPGQRPRIGRVGRSTGGLGADEELLLEVRHLGGAMRLVPRDHIRERMHG